MLSSCDQAAVDAARPQPPLQSALLLLGSQDCDDGLVEHRLQALLGQSGTFHVATGADLRQEQEDREETTTRWSTSYCCCETADDLCVWIQPAASTSVGAQGRFLPLGRTAQCEMCDTHLPPLLTHTRTHSPDKGFSVSGICVVESCQERRNKWTLDPLTGPEGARRPTPSTNLLR